AERLIAGHAAALTLAQVRQELRPAPVPRTFLELEAEAVQLYVEKTLAVDVGTQGPARFGGEVESRQGIWIDDAAGDAAGRQPRQVVLVEDEQSVAGHVAQQRRDERLFGVHVAAPVHRPRQIQLRHTARRRQRFLGD